jgi:hypothetical protein
LYQYKNLPAVSSEQFKLPPRERIVPEHHVPGEPKVLTIEGGERLQEKRAKNAASRNSYTGERKGSSREYNERRSAGHYKSDAPKPSKPSFYRSESEVEGREPKFYKASKDSQKSYYKSDSSSDSDSQDSKPAPAKDPWGNFKGGDTDD